MPGGDRKGPESKGSMTGRGHGFCSGADRPGRENESSRRGGFHVVEADNENSEIYINGRRVGMRSRFSGSRCGDNS